MKKYGNIILLLICLVLSSCVETRPNNYVDTVEVVFCATYADIDSVIFSDAFGICTEGAILVESPKYAEAYVEYKIQEGEPYQFYVVSVWVKAEDFSLQSKSGNGVAITVNDKSDYNGESVASNMLMTNTDNPEWIQLKRVVKLDGEGNLSFHIRTGWETNKSKGRVWIDQVHATSICNDPSYSIYLSTDGKIRMVFKSEDILRSGINEDKLHEWLDIYAKLRESMKWLVGDVEPYEGITDYVFTEAHSYYGLAGNPIYINSSYVVDDLTSISFDISSEDNNILWGYLHEMGHTFDGAGSNIGMKPWVFNVEFFATFKCVYCLYINGYGMGGDIYIGKNIVNHFENVIPLSTGIYSNEGLIYRLLRIMDTFDDNGGWNKIRNTLLAFSELDDVYVPTTNKEKFILFIDLLSNESKCNVKDCFTEKEWEVLMSKFDND